MGTYTKISADAFNNMQLDAGVLLNTFDPTSPAAPDTAIICATTGGIKVDCVPTYSDLGEDVDNVPNNMKEFKHLDSWEAKIGFTALEITEDVLSLALGAATTTTSDHKVVPNRDVKASDFQNIWWVGDLADGGFVAAKLINAISTSGLSMQSTKNGKNQLSCELTGHVSISDQNTMPMEFYVIPPKV